MEPYKILIVDDDPLISEILIHILNQQGQGYLFYKAISGKQGVEIAKEVLPNLIIMDWEMPEMNGIEATKELKSSKETANIPVIISSGVSNSKENMQTAFDIGVVDFIHKPYDKHELRKKVRETLSKINDI